MNEADRMNEAAIARAARTAFERSVAELDADTRARLARARHEALGRLAEPRAPEPRAPEPGASPPCAAPLLHGPARLGRSARLRRPTPMRGIGRELEALLLQPRGWAAAAVAAVLAVSVVWLMPSSTALWPAGTARLSDGGTLRSDGGPLLSDGGAPAPERGVQLASSPDVDLLLDDDELDMLEDLDFYSWLGQQGDPPAVDEDSIG
jgi:hypothetical protein